MITIEFAKDKGVTVKTNCFDYWVYGYKNKFRN